MANKYRHKKTGITVKLGKSGKYVCDNDKDIVLYYIPREVVEESAEWQEITPLIDFFGNEVSEYELHYRVVIDKLGVSHVLNGKNGLLPNFEVVKIVAIFRDYTQACQFQKIYNPLSKDKELLVTPTGNPTTYLKNILKTL